MTNQKTIQKTNQRTSKMRSRRKSEKKLKNMSTSYYYFRRIVEFSIMYFLCSGGCQTLPFNFYHKEIFLSIIHMAKYLKNKPRILNIIVVCVVGVHDLHSKIKLDGPPTQQINKIIILNDTNVHFFCYGRPQK
jgi:hypothetical protein